MLRVGASLSLTGSFSRMGRQVREAIEIWAEDVKREGGILASPNDKRMLPRLVILDDKSLPKEAARLTRGLIRDEGIDILLGPYSSALTRAAAPVAEELGVPLWNHGGSADSIYEQGFRYLVGVVPPAGTYFKGVFEWLRKSGFSGGRVAFLHGGRGEFPAAVVGGAHRLAEGLGFNVILTKPYPASPAGFRKTVSEVSKLRPDLVLGAGRFEEDLAFARAIRESSTRPTLVGLVAAGVSAFGDALGLDAEGFLGPSQWEVGSGYTPEFGPTSTEFANRMTARSGLPADYLGAQAYAACLIAVKCLEQAKAREPASLREAASALRCMTFFGPFRIDPATGRPTGSAAPLLVQWESGKRKILWSPAGPS